MDIQVNFNLDVILTVKILAVIAALWVFWPSRRRHLRFFCRAATFVVAISTITVLTVWKPGADSTPGDVLGDLVAFVTCRSDGVGQSGEAAWCTIPELPAAQGLVRAEDVPPTEYGDKIFTDCDINCPGMIIIPEHSAQRINGSKLAVGIYEVSVREYSACIEEGGCELPVWLKAGSPYNLLTGQDDLYAALGSRLGLTPDMPYDEDPGRPVAAPNVPIVGITWDEARQYTAWLTGKTGAHYRLLTNAEWEYVAIAGISTISNYGAGASEVCSLRPAQSGAAPDCLTGRVRLRTVWDEDPNAFGVFGIQSNAWEWTSDCVGADEDDLKESTCTRRILRGGSNLDPYYKRASSSASLAPDDHLNVAGFRVAKPLEG